MGGDLPGISAMSDHPVPDLRGWQIALRVGFSLAVTCLVAVAAYFMVNWLAGLHP
jgi:hypothetical protein